MAFVSFSVMVVEKWIFMGSVGKSPGHVSARSKPEPPHYLIFYFLNPTNSFCSHCIDFYYILPVSGVNARLASQQREADEHLFLRYLELDPVEGPDAPAAAVQRTKAGIKQGRTPFTTTRR